MTILYPQYELVIKTKKKILYIKNCHYNSRVSVSHNKRIKTIEYEFYYEKILPIICCCRF